MAAYLLVIEHARRRERIFRDRTNPLDHMSDNELFVNYRFSRQGLFYLFDTFCEALQHETKRNHALDPRLQILITLRFFSTGTSQNVFGEIFGVERSTVSKVITRVLDTICRKLNTYVKFPSDDALLETRQDFYQLCGFPRVLGAIDCTHVRLYKAPLGDAEPGYVNRKGWHSINVQLICNAKYIITNIVARWPGSVHDNFILQSSILGRKLANDGANAEGHLLGDSGYAQRQWMMTPYTNIQHPREAAYNRAHRRGRVVIEQTNGQLKQKFPCLTYGLRLSPAKSCKVIIACAILHNISKSIGELHVCHEETPFQDDDVPVNPAHNEAHALLERDILAQRYFS